MQYGLIAQQVATVIPELVFETTIPEIRDTLGQFVEGTSVDLLGVRYDALIPILVAGHQEQNTLLTDQAAMLAMQEEENEELLSEINALKTQMTEMQNQMTEVMSSFQSTQSKMNNCCGTTPTEKGSSETGGIELEQNFPNPFDEVTTINFSITEPAQIRLEISDSQGRVLEVLLNQPMEEGSYTVRWDASAFAPGTYYYSLYADTELLTKKMIKR